MKVAVVILNWNGKGLLKRFLPSVIAHSADATIYVADNASEDGSVDYVYEHFPTVRVIQNPVNGGFAGGYNEALKHLSEDLFVLLNSDVEVTPNWLEPVIAQFETDPNLGAAQPKILDYKNRDRFEYAGAAGGFIDSLGYPFCRGRIFDSIEKDEGQYNDITPIFWATGACMFVRREAFWEAGGFDTDFFAHQEEIDLCWRLHSLQKTVLYVGTSTVYHVGGATLTSESPRKTFYNFRNTLLALVKNVKGGKVWWRVFLRLLLDGLAGIRFILSGNFGHCWAVVRAHFSFYGLLPSFLKKRRHHASRISYAYTRSIVWRYFVQKRRIFREIE